MGLMSVTTLSNGAGEPRRRAAARDPHLARVPDARVRASIPSPSWPSATPSAFRARSPSARRTSASGSPTRGASTSSSRASSRWAWPRSASPAATRPRWSATTGPQLYWAMLATQALGGVPVPLYQDSIEKEMQYIVDHARGALRGGRGPGAGGQAPPRARAVPAARVHRLRRPAGPAALPGPCLLSLDELKERGAQVRRATIRATSSRRSPRAPADDLAVIATPRAPPASPRAPCSRTATSS